MKGIRKENRWITEAHPNNCGDVNNLKRNGLKYQPQKTEIGTK